jgi:FKBP-type peptidyl-prolyl cis-trans isomerase SlyD
MKISDGLYVVFEWAMLSEAGERVGGTEENKPIGFIVGQGHMLPLIEKRLMGMSAGEKATLWLLPGEAFGERDPEKQEIRARDSFPPNIELVKGAHYQVMGPQGPVPIHIRDLDADTVTLDMNHPLAGQRVRLDVHIHEVRELDPVELQQLEDAKRNPVDQLIPPGMTGGTVKV